MPGNHRKFQSSISRRNAAGRAATMTGAMAGAEVLRRRVVRFRHRRETGLQDLREGRLVDGPAAVPRLSKAGAVSERGHEPRDLLGAINLTALTMVGDRDVRRLRLGLARVATERDCSAGHGRAHGVRAGLGRSGDEWRRRRHERAPRRYPTGYPRRPRPGEGCRVALTAGRVLDSAWNMAAKRTSSRIATAPIVMAASDGKLALVKAELKKKGASVDAVD